MATSESDICLHCNKEAFEPVISSCCTEIFCKTCLNLIKLNKKPCPNCGSKNVESLGPQKRNVNNYSVNMGVSCTEEDLGCEWRGDMDELDAHLEVCEYLEIPCDYCDEEDIQRRDMGTHLAQCPDRPYPCPKKCGKSFKRDKLDKHVKACVPQTPQSLQGEAQTDLHKQPPMVAGSSTSHKSNEGPKKPEEKKDHPSLMAASKVSQEEQQHGIKSGQEEQQQNFKQLKQKLQAQQEKCDKNSQEQQERDDSMKQSLQRLHTDLKKQQKDQQTRAEDQQSAHSRLESALKAQEDRTKQDVARLEKQQKQISEQQQKQEAKMIDQQKTIARLDTQLEDQQRSCTTSNTELKKQQAELKKKQDEQQGKLVEQQNTTSRLEALLQEQQRSKAKLEETVVKVEKQQKSSKARQDDDSMKLRGPLEHDNRLAKLERQLVDLKDQQDKQQGTIAEQQATTSQLKARLDQQHTVDESIKQTVATLETEIRAQQLDHQTTLKEQEHTKARLETLVQEQGESTKQSLTELKTGLRRKQGEQDTKLKEQQDELKEQKQINSRLEAQLQKIKQHQTDQQATITEQQDILARLENQLQEQQEILARFERPESSYKEGDRTNEQLKDGLERIEKELQSKDQEVRGLRREMVSRERCMWCWMSIFVVLPTLVIIFYENL